jgi:hypothetical protein
LMLKDECINTVSCKHKPRNSGLKTSNSN